LRSLSTRWFPLFFLVNLSFPAVFPPLKLVPTDSFLVLCFISPFSRTFTLFRRRAMFRTKTFPPAHRCKAGLGHLNLRFFFVKVFTPSLSLLTRFPKVSNSIRKEKFYACAIEYSTSPCLLSVQVPLLKTFGVNIPRIVCLGPFTKRLAAWGQSGFRPKQGQFLWLKGPAFFNPGFLGPRLFGVVPGGLPGNKR